MDMNKDTYNIMYSSDENYVPLMLTSIISLIENSRQTQKIVFYILSDGITKQSKQKIKTIIEKYKCKVSFIPMEESLSKIKLCGINPFGENLNYTAYARLFGISKIGLSSGRLLYLDCDTLIFQSLDSLFEEELNDACIAGVLDVVPQKYKDKIGIGWEDTYINSGVLLVDLQKWNEVQVDEKLKDFFASIQRSYRYPDQDILNIVLKNKIKVIDIKYDMLSDNYLWGYHTLRRMFDINYDRYYSKKIYESQRKDPVIVHFVPNILGRPWQGGLFLKDEWYSYFQKTGYKDEEFIEYRPVTKKRKVLRWMYLHLPEPVVGYIYGNKRRKELNKIE